jgi:O-antigen ligase
MSEQIRALIVILLLSTLGFSVCKRLTYPAVSSTDFKRWRNVWFLVVTPAFLVNNYWLFLAISMFFIMQFAKQEKNKIALFYILVFAVPPIQKNILGFGVVNYLFTMDYIRFIVLIILLPAAIKLFKSNNFNFGSVLTDQLIASYMILVALLVLRGSSITDMLRTLFYISLEVFLPYYVASRSIKNILQFNTVLYAFLVSTIIAAFLSTFESIKHWLLFNSLASSLDAEFSLGEYLDRGTGLRALASLGHPIVLGCFTVIAIGFYLYLSTGIQSKKLKQLGALILGVGLLTPLSRGPWIGALILLIMYILQGPVAFKKLSKFLVAGIVVFGILAITPTGKKFIDLLPIVGKTEKYNIDYREQLFHNSLVVVSRNPLFGSINYLNEPEMLELKQGGGIIDLVNTYVGVTLERGYIGLFLFVGIFISVVTAIRKNMRLITDKRNSLHILGRSLVAVLLSIMFLISTTSSIASLPIMYWSILGLGVAYTRILKLTFSTSSEKLI